MTKFPLFRISVTLSLLFLFLIFACSKDKKEQSEKEESAWAEFDTTAKQPESMPQEEQEEIVRNPNFGQQPIKSGYVKAICLNVRNRVGGEVIGHVFKGDKLDIYETTPDNKWHRINDEAGYVDGWVSAGYISDSVVKSDFIIPEDYKGKKTPTVIEGIDAKYLGATACKKCHEKPHAGFARGPWGVWAGHFHSSAFATLSKPYTKALAKKRGIGNPLTDWRCVKCHVTAFGVSADRLGPNYRNEDGVGCEACHGPGSKYLLPHVNPNADESELSAMGFRVYSNLNDRDQLCRSCHNELSPTYKPFNVEAFSAIIRHWEKEFEIVVTNPEEPPVIKAPKPVALVAIPKETEIAEIVKPPPAKPVVQLIPPKEEAKPEPVESEPKPETPIETEPPVAETKPPTPKPKPPPAPKPSGDERMAGLAVDWMLNTKGPRRGKVFFPHLEHANSYISFDQEAEVCMVCHHKTEVGHTPSNCSDGACHKFERTAVVAREKAFHGNCRTCHRAEDAGPQKCSQCHNG